MDHYYDSYEDMISYSKLREETDWAEISEEQYKLLKKWVNDKNAKSNFGTQDHWKYLILQKASQEIPMILENILDEAFKKENDLKLKKALDDEKKEKWKGQRLEREKKLKKQKLAKLEADLAKLKKEVE